MAPKTQSSSSSSSSSTSSTSSSCLLPRIPDRHGVGGGSKGHRTGGWFVGHAVMVFFTVAVVHSAWSFPSVETALGFYGVYHRDPYNQLIHVVGVPGILWSTFVLQCHLPISNGIVLSAFPYVERHHLSWATLWLVFYVVFYSYLDVVGMLLYSPILYVSYATAVNYTKRDQHHALARKEQAARKNNDDEDKNKKHAAASDVPWTGTGNMLWIAGIVHFLSWYVQIHLGHQVFEGASPAVMANLGGALATAPLFAFYEIIWNIFHVRLSLQTQVHQFVSDYTLELCQSGSNMRVCESILAS